jgi:HNH endonuclease
VNIPGRTRRQVRQRAHFACEYCGVTETDTGGELTVDHYQPQSSGGTNNLDNLLYCCFRCNQYKADYWPTQQGDPVLWNPRQEAMDVHLLRLVNGRLYPITAVGEFTLRRLRLNRPALVAFRLRRQSQAEEQRLLTRLGDLVTLLERLCQQQTSLLSEQRAFLEEQRILIRLLLEQAE